MQKPWVCLRYHRFGVDTTSRSSCPRTYSITTSKKQSVDDMYELHNLSESQVMLSKQSDHKVVQCSNNREGSYLL
jgi:hypothetical protein